MMTDNTAHLQTEFSDVSFEDLQKIEEKVGSKLYNDALFGSEEPKYQRRKLNEDKPAHKKNMHTRRKDMPLEVSSKRPVHGHKNILNAKKQVYRDPRFDDLSGTFDDETFQEDYSFVKDIQEQERKTVQKELRNCEDDEKSARLKKLLYRMNQQDISQKKKDFQRKINNRFRTQEAELIKQGKKPYFLKKSDTRLLELAEQYKDLKKKGKLDKYLAKKRKKNVSKDRKQMPSSSQQM